MHTAKSILSIGHNPTLLTYRHVLLRNAGYRVVSAADPPKAMELVSTRNFDLIIVGLFAHSERLLIERFNEQRNIPVIFLCCDKFNPAVGVCRCHDARLSSREFLRKVAEALSGELVH